MVTGKKRKTLVHEAERQDSSPHRHCLAEINRIQVQRDELYRLVRQLTERLTDHAHISSVLAKERLAEIMERGS